MDFGDLAYAQTNAASFASSVRGVVGGKIHHLRMKLII